MEREQTTFLWSHTASLPDQITLFRKGNNLTRYPIVITLSSSSNHLYCGWIHMSSDLWGPYHVLCVQKYTLHNRYFNIIHMSLSPAVSSPLPFHLALIYIFSYPLSSCSLLCSSALSLTCKTSRQMTNYTTIIFFIILQKHVIPIAVAHENIAFKCFHIYTSHKLFQNTIHHLRYFLGI